MGTENAPARPWRIQLLGGLRAERNGRVVDRFRTRRAAALLGYLALFLNRSHSRETLTTLLWPDAEPETGRTRFRQELYALRQKLETEDLPSGSIFIASRFGLRLNPDLVQTDVRVLERAVQRAAQSPPDECIRLLAPLVGDQHPGDLLPGVYEDWVIPERERLIRLVERATHLLIEAQARLTEPKSIVPPPLPRFEDPEERIVRLPAIFTRFFGRGEEIAQIQEMLTKSPLDRLVTLSGPGGSGKTRLALETARRVADSFPAGVFFVPLADITDPTRAPLAVQQALRLPPADAQASIDEQVIGVLARRGPTLLIFDNLEQLLTTAKSRASLTDFLFALLERTATVSILVTSRRRLDIPGERIVVAHSLPLPDVSSTLAHLSDVPSIALFVDRARSVRPDFSVTERNAVAVADLCRQLDGLPLALELAAARATTLSPAQMLSQLTERLGGRLDSFAQREHNGEQGHRHRSLRAAMQWSQELLSPSLQRVLARLSVFQGGWSADIAGNVLEESEIEEALEELYAGSLVRTVEGEDGILRFYMLETQREFAQEQLSHEERNILMARLARFYCERLQSLRARYGIPTEPALLNFIDTEYENIRATLTWCQENDLILGMALVVQLFVFWLMRGQYQEGIHWFDIAAEVRGGIESADTATKTLYARIAVSSGSFFFMMGRIEEGLHRNQRAATLLEGLSERDEEAEEWLGWAYQGIGLYHNARREHTLAVQWCEKALECMRHTPEARNAGAVLYRYALAMYRAGELPRAEALLQEAFSLLREEDDYWQGYALALRATFAVNNEDYPAARRYFEDSLLHVKRVSFAQYADIEMELASLERELGNLERAREIGEAALQVFRVTGARLRAACMLCHLARTALYAQSYTVAEDYAGEAARLFETLKDEAGIGTCDLLRGHCILERDGDVEQATRLMRRGLTALRHTPLTPDYIPYAFCLLAECALRSDNPHQAGVFLGITANIHQQQSHQARMLPLLRSHFQKMTLQVRQALGDSTAFDWAIAEGSALSMEAALTYPATLPPNG